MLKLEQELNNRLYSPGQSICFVVTSPKPREVFAADFRDRIVHHLLVNHLEPIWEKKFIHHSYSCRKNKGTHRAIKDLKKYFRKISRNYSQPAYYLQADISAFFMSLKKEILFKIIKKHVKNPEILWLTKQIIFQNPTKNFYQKGDPALFKLIPNHKSLFKVPLNQGLPIGNLTSQFFANLYLNELDQFVKHKLKVKAYLRYVDDILLINQDKNKLKIWNRQIDNFLRYRLKLKIHPNKTILNPISQGVNFVGFIIKPDYSLVRRRTAASLKSKIWRFNQQPFPQNYLKFEQELKQILSTINSYYGQFKHANSFKLRKSIYQKHFKILKSYLQPIDPNFSYFQLKKKA